MPRSAGQIDEQKREAILAATAKVVRERGFRAPIEVIARVAKVSKQTIYNHYGSKAELVRDMVARRNETMSGMLTLPADGDIAETLLDFAMGILRPVLRPGGAAILRVAVQGVDEWPELSRQIWAVGPETGARRLADYLQRLDEQGSLKIEDPYRAASFFIGMITGRAHLQNLLRQPIWIQANTARSVCQDAVTRFIRAYEVA